MRRATAYARRVRPWPVRSNAKRRRAGGLAAAKRTGIGGGRLGEQRAHPASVPSLPDLKRLEREVLQFVRHRAGGEERGLEILLLLDRQVPSLHLGRAKHDRELIVHPIL